MTNTSMTPSRTKVATLLALVMSLLYVVSLSTAAQARQLDTTSTTGGSITVVAAEGGDEHSYDVYRLFTGVISDDGLMSYITSDHCMPDAFYDNCDLTGTDQQMAIQLAEGIENDADGSYVAAISRAAVASGHEPVTTIKTGVTTPLDPGWYLLVSEDAQPIVTLVNKDAVTVTEKSVPPSVTKEVLDGNDWTDEVEATIGESVTYRLTGTLPSNYASYKTFAYAFVDELSEGLVPDTDSVVMAVLKADGSVGTVDDGYDVTYEDGTLTVSCDDLKSVVDGLVAGDEVRVTYTASLDPGKVVTGLAEGNPNDVRIRYTRSPSYTSIGESKTHRVNTYSWGLRITKVDSSTSRPLSGASFAIGRSDGSEWLAADGTWTSDASKAKRAVSDDGTLSIDGLASGEYLLREVDTPSGYTSIDDVPVSIKADLGKQTLDVTVASTAAKVTGTDAGTGVSNVQVSNTPTTTTNKSRTTTRDNNTGTSTNRGNSSSSGGSASGIAGVLKGTGTGIAAMSLIIASLVAITGGLVWRRRQNSQQADNTERKS